MAWMLVASYLQYRRTIGKISEQKIVIAQRLSMKCSARRLEHSFESLAQCEFVLRGLFEANETSGSSKTGARFIVSSTANNMNLQAKVVTIPISEYK